MISRPLTGGYMGKILHVDLDTKTCRYEETDPGIIANYFGGSCLGAKIVFDRVGKDVEPYSPDNIIVFTTGPLTGTSIPGSGTYSVVTKSPLTNTLSTAQANGHFGSRLKFAGCDGIVIRGVSAQPVYLNIGDEGVTLVDAGDLAGKNTWETEEILKKRHGGNSSVACIGPAGEKRVRYAVIYNDRGHIAASGGPGAVMGSKKLKAIVVRGGKKVPVACESEFRQLVKEWRSEAAGSRMGRTVSTVGTGANFEIRPSLGTLPVKNYSARVSPDLLAALPLYNGDYLRKKFKMKARACHACNLAHCHEVEVTIGPYTGFVGDEVEYEGLAAWGSNVGVLDPGATTMLSNLVDQLGMDLKEATFTVSMAMECFEKGIITLADTGGIDLTWGNTEGIKKLLERISTRSGLGDTLAEGVMRAASHIGGEAPRMAVHFLKGNAPHVHDVRGMWELVFAQAISNLASFEGGPVFKDIKPHLGIDDPLPLSGPEAVTALPRGVAATAKERQLLDSLVLCNFVCRIDFNVILRGIKYVTGIDYNVQEALNIGWRTLTLARLFALRNGFTAQHDGISPRIAEAPQEGPMSGISISPVFESMKRNYYEALGWERETGVPLPETLRDLSMVTGDLQTK